MAIGSPVSPAPVPVLCPISVAVPGCFFPISVCLSHLCGPVPMPCPCTLSPLCPCSCTLSHLSVPVPVPCPTSVALSLYSFLCPCPDALSHLYVPVPSLSLPLCPVPFLFACSVPMPCPISVSVSPCPAWRLPHWPPLTSHVEPTRPQQKVPRDQTMPLHPIATPPLPSMPVPPWPGRHPSCGDPGSQRCSCCCCHALLFPQ